MVALHSGRADGCFIPYLLEPRQMAVARLGAVRGVHCHACSRARLKARRECTLPPLQLPRERLPPLEQFTLRHAYGWPLSRRKSVSFRMECVAGGDVVCNLAEEPVDLIGARVLLDVSCGMDIADAAGELGPARA